MNGLAARLQVQRGPRYRWLWQEYIIHEGAMNFTLEETKALAKVLTRGGSI